MPSDSVLEEIKNRIDIVDLISEYVHLKHAGQNWKGLCPFHSEKTPSFTVSPSKQIYHCFGCGSGGDVFSFLVKYENVTFPEAVGILAKKAGVTLKAAQKDSAGAGEKEILLNMHRDAVLCFQQQLAKSTKADEYLAKRGITSEARKLFSLGYAPRTWDFLMTYLTRKGYKTELIKKSGLVTQGQKGVYDTFRDRIMFPIYDLKGDVIAFGGRVMDDSMPKYLNSPETLIFSKSKVLYGLNLAKGVIKEAGFVIFVEGYLDVIVMHMHGFTNTVAPLGTALTQEHGKLINKFTEEAIIIFDSDAAGVKAADSGSTLLESALERNFNVKLLSLPEGEDPDSFLRKQGTDAFMNLFKNSVSFVDFLIMQKKGTADRLSLANKICDKIAILPDSLKRGYYIKQISDRLGISEINVREKIAEIRKKEPFRKEASGRRIDKSGPKPEQSKPLDEIYLIKLLLQLPERAGEITGALYEDDFKHATTRAAFNKIKSNPSDFNELLSRCEGDEKALLTEASLMEDFETPEKALEDCINRIRGNKRKLLLQELQYRIKEAEAKKDYNLLKTLQTEQQRILKSRSDL